MLISMAQPLPCPIPTANFAVGTTISRPPNFAHLISNTASFHDIKQIHAQLLKNPQHQHHLFNLLLSSLTFPSYALSLLAFLPQYSPPPSNFANKLLKRLSRLNNHHYSLLFFQRMLSEAFPIDRFILPPLLKAAAKLVALSEGKMIHGLAAKLGYSSDPFVETALMGLYAAAGQISEARLLFDKMSHRDVVAWHIIIDGYSQSYLFDNVLDLLKDMISCGTEPDERIFTCILSACGRNGNLDIGKIVHEFIVENNIEIDSHLQSVLVNMYSGCGAMDLAQSIYDKLKTKNVVASTAMITGYSKTGNIEAARLIFDRMVDKDIICWSAMISGYAESDNPQEALKIYQDMRLCGIKPDQVTLLSVISACANLGALGQAKKAHMFVKDIGFGKALPINNALIDMYAKCGSLEEAKDVFNRMPKKNIISWTSMISAFSIHGDVDNALKHFELMKLENVEPNSVTFVGVLYACSHAGLLEEGKRFFDSMVNEYGISPKLEHYGCMVDLYGRTNHLRDALELVESMPMAPSVVIWGSLMAACQTHSELELGEFAAKRLLEIDPYHDGAHIFLSNIYAREKRWENVGLVRQLMKHKGIAKERGYSMIEVGNEIHQFLMEDKNHKQKDEIYAMLAEAVDKLKQVGYSPNTSCVLVDLNEDEKREAVLWHSEKLALSYGLIVIGKETKTSIRIIKNLRICEDCHNFMKLASKAFDREIVVRDRSRFHHFKDGFCSCKDFW